MIASGTAAAVVTAILLATGTNGKPVPFAAFFTTAGPSICARISEELNAQRQSPTDPEFYCNE